MLLWNSIQFWNIRPMLFCCCYCWSLLKGEKLHFETKQNNLFSDKFGLITFIIIMFFCAVLAYQFRHSIVGICRIPITSIWIGSTWPIKQIEGLEAISWIIGSLSTLRARKYVVFFVLVCVTFREKRTNCNCALHLFILFLNHKKICGFMKI